MYGLTRGTATLLGAAGAGVLLWLGSRFDAGSLGGYWALLGLAAAAGLALAFSQLVGGWTKWGRPHVSRSVLLLGFLPALVAGGLVLLAAQPGGDVWARGWAGDVGLGGPADDLAGVVPAIALALGVLFGFVFDTAGPRVREATVLDGGAADELVTAERPADRDADGVPDAEDDPVARGSRGLLGGL